MISFPISLQPEQQQPFTIGCLSFQSRLAKTPVAIHHPVSVCLTAISHNTSKDLLPGVVSLNALSQMLTKEKMPEFTIKRSHCS
jgi:hypothetical protein